MDFTIALGLGGWLMLIVGALAFGLLAQFVGEAQFGYEWIPDGIAAAIGALVASEFIVGWTTIEPVWDGLAVLPAVVGGLVLGVLVAVGVRMLTGGTYVGGATAA